MKLRLWYFGDLTPGKGLPVTLGLCLMLKPLLPVQRKTKRSEWQPGLRRPA